MILACTCKNTFQDSKYGPGNRVHNRVRPNDNPPSYSCAVCSTERNAKNVDGDMKKGKKGKK